MCRDVLDVTLNLEGNAVIMTDTAGIRDFDCQSDSSPVGSGDPVPAVEKEGILRALQRAKMADVSISVVDGHAL